VIIGDRIKKDKRDLRRFYIPTPLTVGVDRKIFLLYFLFIMCRLERAEGSIVRSMCAVSLREEKSSYELSGRLGIVKVADVVWKSRLHWYGHVERKDVEAFDKDSGGFVVGLTAQPVQALKKGRYKLFD